MIILKILAVPVVRRGSRSTIVYGVLRTFLQHPMRVFSWERA